MRAETAERSSGCPRFARMSTNGMTERRQLLFAALSARLPPSTAQEAQRLLGWKRIADNAQSAEEVAQLALIAAGDDERRADGAGAPGAVDDGGGSCGAARTWAAATVLDAATAWTLDDVEAHRDALLRALAAEAGALEAEIERLHAHIIGRHVPTTRAELAPSRRHASTSSPAIAQASPDAAPVPCRPDSAPRPAASAVPSPRLPLPSPRVPLPSPRLPSPRLPLPSPPAVGDAWQPFAGAGADAFGGAAPRGARGRKASVTGALAPVPRRLPPVCLAPHAAAVASSAAAATPATTTASGAAAPRGV